MDGIIKICNMALSLAGVTKRINSLEDSTVEAQQCAIYYDLSRDGLLQEHAWRFATKHAPLSLTDEKHPGWECVYAYPADCIRLLRVFCEGSGFDGQEWLRTSYEPQRPRLFELYSMKSGRTVLTNMEQAYAEYVSRATDPLQYPSLFSEALAYRLAMELVVPLAAGNFNNRDKLAQYYMRALAKAIEADANEAFTVQENYHTAFEEARR